MTAGELQERLTYWRQVLRLRDWKIAAKFVESSDDIDDSNSGSCHVHQHTKAAIIKLLKPEAYNMTSSFSQAFPENTDQEVTLVHELLHIHFDGLFVEEDDNEIREEREEQAIELIAEALVKLDRGQV